MINKSITIDASNLYDSESQTPGITVDGNAKSRVFLITSARSDRLELQLMDSLLRTVKRARMGAEYMSRNTQKPNSMTVFL